MKLGISVYSISRKILSGEITPQRAVEWLAKEAGAEVIEITPFGIDIIYQETLAGELKKIAEDNGSIINNYSLNANFLQVTNSGHNSEFERVKLHIDGAARLGAATMRIDAASYRRNPEDNTIENFMADLPVIADIYKQLCDYARKYNIVVLIENHGFYINGSDRTGAVLSQVGYGNFAHQLDAGNFLCVDEKPEVAVKRLINKAMTIHLKDFYVRDDDPGDATQFDCSGSWFRSQDGAYLRGSILGQGDMNMKKIAAVIKESGFNGCVYLEFEGMEDCYYGTKVGFDNMKKLLGG
ncbi:MAG: sugar phosphate isomerase/epimerase [Leptospirales bacterium]|nr:sugar phosphate isomerase/epimerase [Leptospirales bacterium]